MRMPYLEMSDNVISLYVTPETEPVSPSMVLIRMPFCFKRGSAPVQSQTEGGSVRRGGVHTVDGALHFVVVERDRRDSIIGPSTNGADGKTVTTRAHCVLDRNVRARVDSHTVILVVHIRARDDDVGTITNVEAVGVHTEGITCFVVDGHVSDGETISAVDGDGLDGRVVDVQIRNGRVREVVGVEEFGLGHTA